MRKWGLRLLRVAYIALIASLPVAALANYTATLGAGANFGSIIIGGVHFASQLLCDATVANQCAGVSAGGAVSVADSALLTAVQAPIPAGTNNIGSVNSAANVTLTDCSSTVATGGTAVNAFTAQTTLHGFTILNDDTAEVMWISFTTTAAASTAGSYPLSPAAATTFANASSFTSPPGMGTNHALSVVAATNGHKFSCTWW